MDAGHEPESAVLCRVGYLGATAGFDEVVDWITNHFYDANNLGNSTCSAIASTHLAEHRN